MIPTRLLWPYVEQMSVLQAREGIMRINEQIYAGGNMDKDDGQTFIHELREQARGESANVQQRPKSVAELAGLISGSNVQLG